METLYQLDANNVLRFWKVIVEDNSYYTQYGIDGMKIITSEKVVCIGKNQGRANETTDDQQAQNEALALWVKKQERGKYTKNIDGKVDNPPPSPMLAKELEEKRLKKVSFCFVSPKLDGTRLLARADGLFSRTGKKYLGLKHIETALAPIFEIYPDIVLDGELYYYFTCKR